MEKLIKIRIIGLEKGEHTAETFIGGEELFEKKYEFHDDIEIDSKLIVTDNRYRLKLDYFGQVKLTCDISAEEYLEDIEGSYELHFKIESEGIKFTGEDDSDRVSLIGNYLDVSELIKQEMILGIPLKRVSPKYRDKEFSQIHPELTDEAKEEEKENPAFSKLKKLNFN